MQQPDIELHDDSRELGRRNTQISSYQIQMSLVVIEESRSALNPSDPWYRRRIQPLLISNDDVNRVRETVAWVERLIVSNTNELVECKRNYGIQYRRVFGGLLYGRRPDLVISNTDKKVCLIVSIQMRMVYFAIRKG
jgi:hypothetical protein